MYSNSEIDPNANISVNKNVLSVSLNKFIILLILMVVAGFLACCLNGPMSDAR